MRTRVSAFRRALSLSFVTIGIGLLATPPEARAMDHVFTAFAVWSTQRYLAMIVLTAQYDNSEPAASTCQH
jgi:hypothetical protein